MTSAWNSYRLLLITMTMVISIVLGGCSGCCKEDPPDSVDMHGKIKPEFTDLSVGVLLTSAADILSSTDWTTKVQNRLNYFLANSSTATFMNPNPENAYSSATTSVDVAWQCQSAIKTAWQNTVSDASSTVLSNFTSMLGAYATLARSASYPIDCHVINMEAPLQTPGGRFTGVTSVALNDASGNPRVIRIILEYTPPTE
jgi:hypothetical protein